MKTEKNILIAFLLNLCFGIIELFGGVLTGSIAIISDALHDLGDSVSIGISFFLERKSKKPPDDIFTYGYLRYSVLGSLITTIILVVSSVLVIIHAAQRLFSPATIYYNGMIIFAAIGAATNLFAAWFTREGDSLNQRAVNLHMLEDVLGWLVVLVGAVVMRFTNLVWIDPVMSISVALFILFHGLKNLKSILDLFLEKLPKQLDISTIAHHICQIPEVENVHHIHIRNLDGYRFYATMHIVTSGDHAVIKKTVRQELAEFGITHSTLELESKGEHCEQIHCHIPPLAHSHRGHHHHR